MVQTGRQIQSRSEYWYISCLHHFVAAVNIYPLGNQDYHDLRKLVYKQLYCHLDLRQLLPAVIFFVTNKISLNEFIYSSVF